jgi:glycosyltransferase involved in cell wall biosynthesis
MKTLRFGVEFPKISIVSSSYNQAKFLKACLSSVKEQNYPQMEHIVIDGGSTDGSVELLREFSSRPGWSHLRWISEPDRGQSDALNKGFRMATGNIIGWLNSDDLYLPGSFQKIARDFQEQEQADLIYGDYLMIDEQERLVQTRREVSFSRFILRHTHVNFVQSSCAVFFSKKILDDGQYIDESYDFAMDYEYFVRLAGAGYRFHHLPSLLGVFRLHGQSKTGSQAKRQFMEHERVRRQNHGLPLEGKIPSAWRIRLGLLRCCANGLRWGEKALRGYYFKQWRIGNLLRHNKQVQIH